MGGCDGNDEKFIFELISTHVYDVYRHNTYLTYYNSQINKQLLFLVIINLIILMTIFYLHFNIFHFCTYFYYNNEYFKLKVRHIQTKYLNNAPIC